MTEKQKAKYFTQRAKYWAGKFLIDPQNTIAVVIDEEQETTKGSDDDNDPEWLKLEEKTVTSLTRIFVGEQKFLRYSALLEKGSGATIAWCDDSMAAYWRFKLHICRGLLWYSGEEFKIVADVVACHECLHILLWHLSSYMRFLETK